MTSYTTKGSYPYPDPTDAVTDYPSTASTFAGYVDNLPNRNRIINGTFDIWQRGQSLGTLATGSYTADRWRLDYDGAGGTRTVGPSGYGAGVTIGGMQPRLVPNITLTNAGTSTSQRFGQRIEDVRTFAGETVTLSFWCLSTVAPKTITAKAVQNFGTGGSPSAAVTTTIGSVTTTTAMVRKSFTFTVPALTGKNIGTNEDSYLEIHFEFGSQTGTFQIWGVQLEQNTTATALEREPIQQTIAKCQRYYCKTFNLTTAPAAGAGQQGAIFASRAYASLIQTYMVTWFFPVEMRVAPNASSYNPSTAGQTGWYDEGGVNVAAQLVNGGTRGLLAFNSAASTINRNACIHIAADAEL